MKYPTPSKLAGTQEIEGLNTVFTLVFEAVHFKSLGVPQLGLTSTNGALLLAAALDKTGSTATGRRQGNPLGYVSSAPKIGRLVASRMVVWQGTYFLLQNLETCFLQALVGKVVRVRDFDVIFSSSLPEGPERCPAEGGWGGK